MNGIDYKTKSVEINWFLKEVVEMLKSNSLNNKVYLENYSHNLLELQKLVKMTEEYIGFGTLPFLCLYSDQEGET